MNMRQHSVDKSHLSKKEIRVPSQNSSKMKGLYKIFKILDQSKLRIKKLENTAPILSKNRTK